MTDHLTKEKRSWNMSRIKAKDTTPERAVRSFLHIRGYRFRLHSKKLPGNPDLVLTKHKTLVFVHGCYWHHHDKCRRATWPKTNQDYWIPKIKRNIERDKHIIRALKELGWNVIVVWECETKDPAILSIRLNELIG